MDALPQSRLPNGLRTPHGHIYLIEMEIMLHTRCSNDYLPPEVLASKEVAFPYWDSLWAW